MKKLLVIVLLCLSPHLYSQRTLTDEQWLEDLDFMVSRIDSVHPFFCTDDSRKPVHRMAEELKKRIPVLTDEEILVELMKIVTIMHDGHTRLHGRNLTKTWYPIRIEKFSDGFYITATSREHSRYIGSRVLLINKQAVGTVFERLIEITPGDNMYSREYFAPMYLTMTSVVSGLQLTESTEEALIINVLTKDKSEAVLSVLPISFETGDDLGWYWKEYAVPADNFVNIIQSSSPLPLYLQNYSLPYWYRQTGEKMLYFAFNSCENDAKENFSLFNERLWNTIDSINAEYLIIDLRNNFGGTNSILEPLVREIIKHDRINRNGHLFVITGKKTFSAAVHCATWIEYHCTPVFAGEPAAAGPNHYADPDFSFLPNSKILLMISRYYWQNSWPWDSRLYIEPEIKISLTAADYFTFRDPVMEGILGYIQQNIENKVP